MVQKMTLLQKIINNAGFLNHLMEKIRSYYVGFDGTMEDCAIDLLNSISYEKAGELAEIFKVISNRLLDFGMDHTEEYLSGKENP
jgi:hypothetical protein